MKIGDRVYHEIYGKGTVIYDDSDILVNFLVRFDKRNKNLHSGNDKFCFPERCWYCDESDLIIIDDTTIYQLLLCKER